jgi:NTP pyrophosphatase (non-canonical NTP hydrolase)
MVSQAADRIFPRRTYDTILKSLMEEVGELSTEIAIKQGTKKRAASVDGVKGEAVDVFIVAVDMLRNAFGDKLHTSEFTDAVRNKLNKWEGV